MPLQVPEDSLAEYLGKWDDPPYAGGHSFLPHHAPRAAYAAMITRLDRDVGRMMDLVNQLGLENETLFVFTSDHGPVNDNEGGSDVEFFNSAAGFRGLKGSLYEGGIRVPSLVRWMGHVLSGRTSDRITGHEDWMSTLLQLVGAEEATPGEIDGISFAPTLLGQSEDPRPFLYREFPGFKGCQSVRVGDWKGVRPDLLAQGKKAQPDLHIELYDLSKDPWEAKDVSAEHPEIVAQMERLMREQHTPSKLFPIPALDRLTTTGSNTR
jgi:arylsulfatase A-like enzyme